MPDSRATIVFPPHLSKEPINALSTAPSPSDLNHLQIQLALCMYARADQDRVDGRADAVPAHFLRVIVNLIDVLEMNGVDDAAHCMVELKKIINTIYSETPGYIAARPN